MQAGTSLATDSKDRKSGPSNSPGGQPARAGVTPGGGLEVGSEERVGELSGDHGLRHDLTFGGGRGFLGPFLLDGRLDAGRFQHLAPERLGGVGDVGVLFEKREKGGAAGGGLGEDRGHALEALELLRAVGFGAGLIGLDAGALLRIRSATTWNFVRTEGITCPFSTARSTSRTARASTGMMPSSSRARARCCFRGALPPPGRRRPRRATNSSSGSDGTCTHGRALHVGIGW